MMQPLKGRSHDEYNTVKRAYGTSIEAYEALLNYPFKYGNFVPCDHFAEVVRGLTAQ